MQGFTQNALNPECLKSWVGCVMLDPSGAKWKSSGRAAAERDGSAAERDGFH